MLEKEKNKMILEKKRKNEKETLKKLLEENEQNDREYLKQKRAKLRSPRVTGINKNIILNLV